MNYYKYYEEISNYNDVNNFYNKTNFIGYILPDGNIYPCKNHNIESIISAFNMCLSNLVKNYEDREFFLVRKSNDPILQLILNFLWNLSQEEVIEFYNFIKNNKIDMSDLLVSLFGCHLVTRLNKKILTSNILHYPFYNYILMDFTIETVPKIIYKDNEFMFKEKNLYNDDFLFDEIKMIKENASSDEKRLFFK